MVCRTQGDRPLLSKVSLARIQVMVLLLHPSLFPLSFRGPLGREDKISGEGTLVASGRPPGLTPFSPLPPIRYPSHYRSPTSYAMLATRA